MKMRAWPVLILTALAGPFLAGCGTDSPVAETSPLSTLASETPAFASATFVPAITNPYLNFAPGRKFHYRSETPEGTETNVVEVTSDTKSILGVATTVLHDQVFLDNQLTEDTFDWVAQDEDGNVWYFGEDSKEYLPDGTISTEGSWTAGIDGNPGILMLADPEGGEKYKQEDASGIAEDMAKVVSLSAEVNVPYGMFSGALQTSEWSLLESGPRDYKYYKRDVGLLLEVGLRGKKQVRSELVAID